MLSGGWYVLCVVIRVIWVAGYVWCGVCVCVFGVRYVACCVCGVVYVLVCGGCGG